MADRATVGDLRPIMELPLHPKLVHLPMALAILMPLLTSGVLLAIWRDWFPKRVWSLVIVGQFLLVGSGILALRSGEADEERVEKVVAEVVLERHEEAGERFVWVGGFLLAITVLPLLLRSKRATLITGAASCAGTFVVLAFGYQVGQLGGEIVYGHNGASVYATATPGGALTMPAGKRALGDDDR